MFFEHVTLKENFTAVQYRIGKAFSYQNQKNF